MDAAVSDGSFELVDDVLAEDYVLGRVYSERGFNVDLSAHRLEAVTARGSLL